MFNKLITYIQNVRIEMSKVIWPTREVLLESTGVTLLLTLMIALFIFTADQIINRAINLII